MYACEMSAEKSVERSDVGTGPLISIILAELIGLYLLLRLINGMCS